MVNPVTASMLLKRGADALSPEQLFSLKEDPQAYQAIVDRLQALVDATRDARADLTREREALEQERISGGEEGKRLAEEREGLAAEQEAWRAKQIDMERELHQKLAANEKLRADLAESVRDHDAEWARRDKALLKREERATAQEAENKRLARVLKEAEATCKERQEALARAEAEDAAFNQSFEVLVRRRAAQRGG